jgi:hypothetical protein
MFQTHSQTVFSVNGHQEGKLCLLLVTVGQPGLLQRLSLEEKNPTHFLPTDLPADGPLMFWSHVGIPVDHDHLGNPVFERKGFHHRIHPGLSGSQERGVHGDHRLKISLAFPGFRDHHAEKHDQPHKNAFSEQIVSHLRSKISKKRYFQNLRV